MRRAHRRDAPAHGCPRRGACGQARGAQALRTRGPRATAALQATDKARGGLAHGASRARAHGAARSGGGARECQATPRQLCQHERRLRRHLVIRNTQASRDCTFWPRSPLSADVARTTPCRAVRTPCSCWPCRPAASSTTAATVRATRGSCRLRRSLLRAHAPRAPPRSLARAAGAARWRGGRLRAG